MTAGDQGRTAAGPGEEQPSDSTATSAKGLVDRRFVVVEACAGYSNLGIASGRLVSLRAMPCFSPARIQSPLPLSPQRVERRLGAELVERVVSVYVGGVSSARLARHYGTEKGTPPPGL